MMTAQWLQGLRRDAWYACRVTARSPFVAAIVIGVLALGIGANTAVFSIVDAVLLRPLPISRVDDLVIVQDDFAGLNLHHTQVSVGEALDLFARHDLFSNATAMMSASVNVSGLETPMHVTATSTLGDFFGVFDVHPFMGRVYRPDAGQTASHHVAVLSYGLWQDLTGGDVGVIGKSVRLDDSSYEVVGVLPPDFRYPRVAQLWRPMAVTPSMLGAPQRTALAMTAVARLRPGIAASALQSRLADEASHWHEQFGSAGYPTEIGHTVVNVPFVSYVAGPLRQILIVLSGAVLIVLLIACTNVATLQTVRVTGRSRTIAIQTTLGATQWRLVQPLLVENAMLAFLSGLGGLGVGAIIIRLVTAFDIGDLAAVSTARLNGHALAFTAAATLLTALLFGTLPVLQLGRRDLSTVLNESGGRDKSAGLHRMSFLKSAITLQVALALVLVLASSVVVRSLSTLLETNPGFQTSHVLTLQVSLGGSRYATPAARLAFHDALIARVRNAPTVQSVGTAFGMPYSRLGTSSPFTVVGRPPLVGAEPHANVVYVGGDYFQTMGIPLIAGRTFQENDRADSLVAFVIDATLAKQYFPNEDPLNHQLHRETNASGGETGIVVGVVGGVRTGDLTTPARPTIYAYLPKSFGSVSTLSMAVRTTSSSQSAAALLKGVVRELDKDLPAFAIVPMQMLVDESLGTRRVTTVVLTCFAVLSLLLAVLGIYGILSYGVSERRHEIGVRLALGADPQRVVRHTVIDALVPATIGLLIGVAVFVFSSHVLTTLTYGVAANDPLTILGGVIILLAATVLSSWAPAKRASSVDPLEALRE